MAVVQDWLPVYGGAERVTEQILAVFPQADVYSLIDSVPPPQRAFLGGRSVTTSFIQRLPFGKSKYRYYLPLMPVAIEQFDLVAYDIVISISNAFAKGVITGPDQLHVSYVNSPMRFAWDLQHEYLRQTGFDRHPLGPIVRWQLHLLRQWDVRTTPGVDHMIANSTFIARRIWKTYRREAAVVHPPVDTQRFSLGGAKEDFYFTVSRLVPYKRVDAIVQAFGLLPDRRLVVIGDGPEMARIRRDAPPNVSLLGYQEDAVVLDHMRRARAFLFAAQEDFGIVPVEAQAAGTPVVAFGRGGVLDSVLGLDDARSPTGVFFESQTPQAIADGVRAFEANETRFDAERIREHALSFDAAIFRERFRDHVAAAWAAFDESRSGRVVRHADAEQRQGTRS